MPKLAGGIETGVQALLLGNEHRASKRPHTASGQGLWSLICPTNADHREGDGERAERAEGPRQRLGIAGLLEIVASDTLVFTSGGQARVAPRLAPTGETYIRKSWAVLDLNQ
jgi:hypothetical protein